jgi:hypothetical protein
MPIKSLSRTQILKIRSEVEGYVRKHNLGQDFTHTKSALYDVKAYEMGLGDPPRNECTCENCTKARAEEKRLADLKKNAKAKKKRRFLASLIGG